jgi:hypothetical protein
VLIAEERRSTAVVLDLDPARVEAAGVLDPAGDVAGFVKTPTVPVATSGDSKLRS